MSQVTALDSLRKDPRDSTTAFSNRPVAAERQHVVFVPGGGTTPHYTREVSCLLRRRLRIAGLISLVASAAFLVRAFVLISSGHAVPPVGLALHCVLLAVLIGSAMLLWSKVELSMRALRWVEFAMFGMMAAFFVYLHFVRFYDERVLDMVASDEAKLTLFSALNAANCLRWFILIVLYGAFIPNSWKRCALVVGGMALTPILLSVFLGCVQCPVLGGFVWHGMFEMVATLSIAAAIAIFGSYKISELSEQAFQARRLGQYLLHRRLGSGGMGEVYLGEHTMLRRSCAIKLIRPDQAGDPTTLSRFEREVQAMATLTHWNTVEVYDYGLAEDGTFYYVMEDLPGLSLQGVGRPPWPALARPRHLYPPATCRRGRAKPTPLASCTATSSPATSSCASAAASPTSPNCSISASSRASASRVARTG
ncbi:MAG: hypothetical protein U0793_10145 [Gemmataceae bacterium]